MHTTQLLATIRARHEAFRTARDLTRDRLAPDFSPFQFMAPDELGLSRLLAWLLDPKGSHGQNERFLEAFLARLDAPWNGLSAAGATVATEAPTDRNDWANRRIDILVRGQGWTLAIENKPWAGDQKDQVKDYLGFLEKLRARPYGLVYLSGWGSAPSPDSISKTELDQRVQASELHLRSYAQLVPWLEVCKGLCRADRVVIFIDEFIRYIQRHFQGIRDMTEREQIIEAATGSPAATEAAMHLILAGAAVEKHLLRRLAAQVEADCPPGWIFTQNVERDNWAGLSLQFPAGSDYKFRIEFISKSRQLGFGICKIDQAKPPHPDLTARFNRAFGKGQSNDLWPWYRHAASGDELFPVDFDWSATPRPWMMIAEGTLHTRIIKAARQLHQVLVENGLVPQDPVGVGLVPEAS